ncbi:MAG: hypothetical protein AAGE59_13395 [Cyanobacteria bacterium P01_F01_bin.86]
MMEKVSVSGNRKRSQTFKIRRFEDQCDQLAFCRMLMQGEDIGAHINRRSNRLTHLSEHDIVYGWAVEGIDPMVYPGQAEAILRRIEQPLKNLSDRHRITFRFRSTADDTTEQQQLSRVIQTTQRLEAQYFLGAKSRHIRELTNEGRRQHKSITIFASYRLGEFDNKGRSWLEKAVGNIEFYKDQVFGKEKQMPANLLRSLLLDAFNNGYLPLKAMFEAMGLRVRPLTVQELWDDTWLTFNPKQAFDQQPPGLGYHLVIEDKMAGGETAPREQSAVLYEDFIDETYNSIDPLSLAIHNNLPRARRACVELAGKLVGVLGLEEKPAAFVSPSHLLLYFWNAICNIPDCEIVCALAPSPKLVTKIALQRVAKESIAGQKMASHQNSINVEAGLNLSEAMDAQRRIYKGASPISVSVAAFLHRDTVQQLDNACRDFIGNFSQGRWQRETDAAWMVWLNSLPFSMNALFNDNRRKVYLSDEVAALLPIVAPFAGDESGMHFITKQGRSPVHCDIYSRQVGLLIFGESRSGKSATAAEAVIGGLARGLNVLAIDYPKPGGIHSFGYLAKMFSQISAYVDVATEKNNILQPPNPRKLAQLPDTIRASRMRQHYDFCATALTLMVMGDGSSKSSVGKRVRSLFLQSIPPFYEHYHAAFAAAFDGGLGSTVWQQMPTLHHFLEFIRQFDFDMPVGSDLINEALSTIILELRTWLQSRVGQAISAPSTIDPDAQFSVFALDSVNDDIDAAIIALSAQSFMLRKAFELRSCISIVDEAPVLLKFEALARIVGMMCSNGMASGIKPIIISQDPASISHSMIASQITNNLKIRLIGAITRNAAKEFERLLGYDPDILQPNTTEQFFTNPQTLSSSWLLDMDAKLVRCEHYLPPEWLAAMANNKSEIWLRDTITAQYSDKFEAHSAFTKFYVEALKAGKIDYLYNHRDELDSSLNLKPQLLYA